MPRSSSLKNPQIKHGVIKILFTPDEEIGRGVDKADLKKLGADFAYTMDGETAGTIEDETFSADGATITIDGVSTHPGFAKGKMEHAIKIAAAIVDRLPKETCSPETTEGREGFLHPIGISGALEQVTLSFIVRDFAEAGLKEKEALLEGIVKDVIKAYPRSTYRMEVKEQYRNMKVVIDRHPEIVDHAVEAIRRAGLKPVRGSIRGGTDGARLSFMGLPCPNIFAGEHAFHSRLEWVSRQDMEKAVQTIVHLAMIWEERSLTRCVGPRSPIRRCGPLSLFSSIIAHDARRDGAVAPHRRFPGVTPGRQRAISAPMATTPSLAGPPYPNSVSTVTHRQDDLCDP